MAVNGSIRVPLKGSIRVPLKGIYKGLELGFGFYGLELRGDEGWKETVGLLEEFLLGSCLGTYFELQVPHKGNHIICDRALLVT